MPELKVKPKARRTPKRKEPQREYVFTSSERQALKRIGLRIHKILYEQGKSVEWLGFKIGVARSALNEIIAGRSNPKFLTLRAIVLDGLGYKNLNQFFREIEE
ncbi:MAG: hypothetical protein A2428_17965 [Bdellovibrionales bacterium RIFOXYC1_FULL_54_43]|nr:MAG: hypothetical protein A2428_17965 [Bdellovibrionales bacterium RIFOXYC1_FULL_54_43]OFZ79708.1 MAG: hypothetical protein A2603_06155 [Bdellovibrionales bacterium RIFOXYD1_FULL_55_31]